MDTSKLKAVTHKIFHKYKYAILILILGMALMVFPISNEDNAQKHIEDVAEPSVSVEEELKIVLSQIRGVGNVDIMLKEQTGEEYIYQTDEDTVSSDSSTSIKNKTITVTDEERNDIGLIRQIKPPTYQGAIIVCQGGDDPKIRLDVAEAVSKITGLGLDRIAVLKMK